MEKVRAIISDNLLKHSQFEEYFKIIEIIEEHTFNNPDICIESCKALVEGISKTILINLDNTKTTDNIDKDDLPKLFKETMRKLSDECEDIEGDFAARFSAIIQVIGEIRNKRSDISHGRMAPKFIFSSSKLASTIVDMTDSMLEYILVHYFSIKFSKHDSLDYDSEELKDYNDWLDESVDFPIKKARYSKLLYENDYDEYESRYSDEYMKSIEDEPEEVAESKEEAVDIEEKDIVELIEPEGKEVIVEVIKDEASIDHPIPEEIEKITVKKVIKLVADFNEKTFWTDSKNQALQEFANAENLKFEELKEVVNEYLFSDKPPLRDDVVNTMVERPKLLEFKTVIPSLTEKIMTFADNLKKSVEEV